MKLLKVEIIGDKLYKDSKFTFDLFASDRVILPNNGEPLSNVYKIDKTRNVYSQNVIGISGVNAAGKTTAIELLEFAAQYLEIPYTIRLLRSAPMKIPAKLDKQFSVRIIFSHDNFIYAIVADLERQNNKDPFKWYRIKEEKLYQLHPQKLTKILLNNTDRFIESASLILKRSSLGADERKFLPDNTSITIALPHRQISDAHWATGRLAETSYSTAIVNAFDPSVERLNWDSDSEVYHLKFYGEPERSLSQDAAEQQLSSGTLVGSEMVLRAIDILKSGGMLMIDEIEDSLNKSLVHTVIDLFLSSTTNPNGAQLIFTTHYPEILDYLPRKDDMYILLRNDDHRTSVVKYSEKVNRIEKKKSEVILSNYLSGTLPNYPDIRDLRDFVIRRVSESKNEQ